MYIDKVPKKKSSFGKAISSGGRQVFHFQDNRISQMKQRAEICQMQAWVGTRTLGMTPSAGSGSSGVSGAGVAGNTAVPLGGHHRKGFQIFDPQGTHHTWGVHAHLLFDNVHGFPGGITSNNIGYGGHGLFTETYNYKTIGHVMPNERCAHLAVLGVGHAPNTFNITGAAYNLTGHNCQLYAMEVFNMYNTIQAPLANMLASAQNLHDAYLANAFLPPHIANLAVARAAFNVVCRPLPGLHCGYNAFVTGLRNTVILGGHPGTVGVANALLQVMNTI